MSTTEQDLERKLRSETGVSPAATAFDILRPEHFVCAVRGATHVRNTGISRECRVEILARNASGAEGVVAVFGCRAAGWLRACEVGLLNTGKRTLMWKRKGKQAEITIDGRREGRIELGWMLQHAYIGSGTVWFGGSRFCGIALPFFGPSSPQPHDCTGRFTLSSDRKAIKFVINAKDAEGSNITMRSGLAWGWDRLRGRTLLAPDGSQPGMRSRRFEGTIFYPSDQARLAELGDGERLILLALAVWPWSLYKGGGT